MSQAASNLIRLRIESFRRHSQYSSELEILVGTSSLKGEIFFYHSFEPKSLLWMDVLGKTFNRLFLDSTIPYLQILYICGILCGRLC